MRSIILLSALCWATACEDDPLGGLSGSLVVEVLNARAEATDLVVKVDPGSEKNAAVARPSTQVSFEKVTTGLVRVEVTAVDANGAQLDRVSAFPVAIVAERESRVIIDLATGIAASEPPPVGTPGVCLGEDKNDDGVRDPLDVVCATCNASDGSLSAVADDPDCGDLSCASLDGHRIFGENTATGRPKCLLDTHPSIKANRCKGPGECKAAETVGTCTEVDSSVVLEAGICELIDGCSGATGPTKRTASDGTPCGTDKVCLGGACVPVTPEVGCADGAREGFTDQARYPLIAGCAGAWDVPGLLSTIQASCGRAGGDDGASSEGRGCAAVDLCAAGWHICGGQEEVQAKAGGCGDAVPAGAPDKSLFFAVVQTSDDQTVCGGAQHNDVFGCGNLGTALGADKNCGPLNRALASTQRNSCGFNEAEPNLGPWQCLGGADSHLREGEIVTKAGCPNRGCMYDGQPIGNSDKGGVLCCRN